MVLVWGSHLKFEIGCHGLVVPVASLLVYGVLNSSETVVLSMLVSYSSYGNGKVVFKLFV